MLSNSKKCKTLDQWLEWQQQLHPKEIELGLNRVRNTWKALGSPSLAKTIITVAGTNGKGSSVAYLEAIYTAAGYSVGSYTSPHLHSYTERIRINGQEVAEQVICDAFERIDEARQNISLTYFEFGTLAAFDIFSDRDLDIAILEVGLGGRLDAVNIVDADCVLLTPISIDHVAWLGDTRELIGAEKAGVLRSEQIAICADSAPPDSVLEKARQLKLKFWQAEQDYHIEETDTGWNWVPSDDLDSRVLHSLPFPAMRGQYQISNAAGAIAVVMGLYDKHPVSTDAIRVGLHTTVAGRFDVVSRPVTWIFDVAHNVESARVLSQNLAHMCCNGTTRALCSVLDDKDLPKIVDVIKEHIGSWVFCPLSSSRGRSLQQLETDIKALMLHDNTRVCAGIKVAIQTLIEQSKEGDRIVVFGSFVLVAQAMALINNEEFSLTQ